MIRFTAITIIGLAILAVSPGAKADIHLEIGLAATPTVAQDPASPTGFRETPLDFTEPVTHRTVELWLSNTCLSCRRISSSPR